MKIYVASSFDNKDEVHSVQQQLRDDGHTISHDWTTEDATGKTGEELKRYLAQSATQDYIGVHDADLVIVLDTGHCQGAWTELGIAIGLGKPSIIVQSEERRPNIFGFLSQVFVVRDLAGMLQSINARFDWDF